MTTYRFFPDTDGPDEPAVYSSTIIEGLTFKVSQGGVYLDGFWWWVCPDENGSSELQPVTAQPFALWSIPYLSSGGTGFNGDSGQGWSVVPASEVTSGTLTRGQWNYIPLPAPILLAQNVAYIAATGLTGAFPSTNGYFGSGDTEPGGITNAVATAYSDQGGTSPLTSTPEISQGLYSTASADPFTMPPTEGNESFNPWIDVQLDTSPAAPVTGWQIWPNYPVPQYEAIGETTGFTLGADFTVSEPCTLGQIRFFSPPDGGSNLPSRCAIWVAETETELAGTDNSDPVWLLDGGGDASAGDGWMYCDYSDSGVVLAAGIHYRAAVFYDGASGDTWFAGGADFWASGAGADGLTQGPLTMSAANSWFDDSGTWGYPGTEDGANDNWWVDVQVIPVAVSAANPFLLFPPV